MRKSIKKMVSAPFTLDNVLMTKKYLMIFVTVVGLLVIGQAMLLNSAFPIDTLGSTVAVAILVFETAFISLGCFFLASQIITTVIRRKNEQHFINLPSLLLAAIFFYGGVMMAMEVLYIWVKLYWLTVLIRMAVGIILGYISLKLAKMMNYIINLPNLDALKSEITKLQHRITVLKATSPYTNDDDKELNSPEDLEKITETLKKVSGFLTTFEKKSVSGEKHDN